MTFWIIVMWLIAGLAGRLFGLRRGWPIDPELVFAGPLLWLVLARLELEDRTRRCRTPDVKLPVSVDLRAPSGLGDLHMCLPGMPNDAVLGYYNDKHDATVMERLLDKRCELGEFARVPIWMCEHAWYCTSEWHDGRVVVHHRCDACGQHKVTANDYSVLASLGRGYVPRRSVKSWDNPGAWRDTPQAGLTRAFESYTTKALSSNGYPRIVQKWKEVRV